MLSKLQIIFNDKKEIGQKNKLMNDAQDTVLCFWPFFKNLGISENIPLELTETVRSRYRVPRKKISFLKIDKNHIEILFDVN